MLPSWGSVVFDKKVYVFLRTDHWPDKVMSIFFLLQKKRKEYFFFCAIELTTRSNFFFFDNGPLTGLSDIYLFPPSKKRIKEYHFFSPENSPQEVITFFWQRTIGRTKSYLFFFAFVKTNVVTTDYWPDKVILFLIFGEIQQQ